MTLRSRGAERRGPVRASTRTDVSRTITGPRRLSPSPAAPGGADLPELGVDRARRPGPDRRDDGVEDLQEMEPLLFAQLADARGVVPDRLADDLTLRLAQPVGGAPELGDRGVIEWERGCD